jgi:hypothetical protein
MYIHVFIYAYIHIYNERIKSRRTLTEQDQRVQEEVLI